MFRYLIDKIRNWKKLQSNRESLITIEISQGALKNNLKSLQKLVPQWQIAPVLKSNAYGHGITLIADILKKEANLPFFCIDSYFEAEQLRSHNIQKPLLILGHTPTTTIEKNKLKNIHFVIGSLEQLQILINKKIKQTVQIKFDTGMHRQGIPGEQIEKTITLIKQNKNLQIAGALSHLASAENPNSELTKKQINNWNLLAKQLQQNCPTIQYYHLTNSAGLIYYDKIIANVGRSGHSLYGINLENLPISLQPVLKMKSLISEIREIKKGETVGYAGTFSAQQKTTIATIPVGYFEGVDIRLANKGFFLIKKNPVPLVGLVSMNISACDISNLQNLQPGEEVIIISNHTADPNSIKNIAQTCQTIPYEILVHLPSHLRRKLIA